MLGKITFWNKEARMGVVQDVEGHEWNVLDDMMDDDALKAKVSTGSIVNFEANPSLDNSAMSLTMADPDQASQFKDDHKAMLKANEEKEQAALSEASDSFSEQKILAKVGSELAPLAKKFLAEVKPKNLHELQVMATDEVLDFADRFVHDQVLKTIPELVEWALKDPYHITMVDDAIKEDIYDDKPFHDVLAAAMFVVVSGECLTIQKAILEYLKENHPEVVVK